MRLSTTSAIVFAVLLAGCGHQPALLASRRDIAFTSVKETHAIVANLPARDFPALAKFHRLYEVMFSLEATDEKLSRLAQVRLTNLTSVVLTDCPLVTDQGVAALSGISSLRALGLRNVPAITDTSCEIIANKMRIRNVNLPDCPKVTVNGLMELAQSETIEELGFSLGNLTQDDLLRLVGASRRLTRMDTVVTDVGERKLDVSSLRKAAIAKSIELYAVRSNRVSRL